MSTQKAAQTAQAEIIPMPACETEAEKDARAREIITQLAIAHMVSGLRVLNRMRHAQGLPSASSEEIATILGMDDGHA